MCRPSILILENVRYAKVFEYRYEGLHLVEILGHRRVPSLGLISDLAGHKLGVGEDP